MTVTVELTPEQVAQLGVAAALAKAVASPARLAILGALAGRQPEPMLVADLAAGPMPITQIERDLQQLADAGLIRITEWRSTRPGGEPHPYEVTFNPAYLHAMPAVIGTLQTLLKQAQPPGTPVADDTERALERFFQNGRLISFPVQAKHQRAVLNRVVAAFDLERSYPEREVDAILKDIYAYDHCTLRRYLVDYGYMDRSKGIYQRRAAQVVGA
ncbi:MAG: DUF2087 domain-containing protein [Chloroflexota bacterium]|nr:DUF2087 domain-containing protein [Chloroflexota bacterium]